MRIVVNEIDENQAKSRCRIPTDFLDKFGEVRRLSAFPVDKFGVIKKASEFGNLHNAESVVLQKRFGIVEKIFKPLGFRRVV